MGWKKGFGRGKGAILFWCGDRNLVFGGGNGFPVYSVAGEVVGSGVFVEFEAEDSSFVEVFTSGAEGGIEHFFVFFEKMVVLNYNRMNDDAINQHKGESPPESIVQPVSEEPDDGNKDESPYDSPEDDISHLSGSIYM